MRHSTVEDTSWPVDDGDTSVQWKLRYGGELTRSERLFAASILASYTYLSDPAITQTAAINALKRARRARS